MTEIIELINSVGVTVAVLMASMYYIYYTYNKHREDIREQREMYQALLTREQEAHSKEMDAVTEAINNNTLIITKLYETMTREEA